MSRCAPGYMESIHAGQTSLLFCQVIHKTQESPGETDSSQSQGRQFLLKVCGRTHDTPASVSLVLRLLVYATLPPLLLLLHKL